MYLGLGEHRTWSGREMYGKDIMEVAPGAFQNWAIQIF